MLLIKDSLPSTDVHQFILSSVSIDNRFSFELTSETYLGVKINFTLEYERITIPTGYTVSVHLFKNKHFSQRDIVDFRLNELINNNGRAGYFFRLDALFEEDILQINRHTLPYAYYALEYIFSSGINIQTKEVELSPRPYQITDFFDDDTIVLVVCNEYSNVLNNFAITSYLPPLFLKGFIKFDRSTNIGFFNETSIVEDGFNEIKGIERPDGVFVLRISSPHVLLIQESFILYLFQKLLQQQNETITRFITLYQVIEISISKIFHLKVQSRVCNNLNTLTSFQLKKFLTEIQTEKFRIVSLLNDFSRPTAVLDNALKETIIDFFMHVQDVDYLDPAENANLTLTDVFYDYRNKLVHNYRLIHSPGVDSTITQNKMELINELTEVLVSQIISNFRVI